MLSLSKHYLTPHAEAKQSKSRDRTARQVNPLMSFTSFTSAKVARQQAMQCDGREFMDGGYTAAAELVECETPAICGLPANGRVLCSELESVRTKNSTVGLKLYLGRDVVKWSVLCGLCEYLANRLSIRLIRARRAEPKVAAEVVHGSVEMRQRQRSGSFCFGFWEIGRAHV